MASTCPITSTGVDSGLRSPKLPLDFYRSFTPPPFVGKWSVFLA